MDLLESLLGDGSHLLITITLTHLRHSSKIMERNPKSIRKMICLTKEKGLLIPKFQFGIPNFPDPERQKRHPFAGIPNPIVYTKVNIRRLFDAPLNLDAYKYYL